MVRLTGATTLSAMSAEKTYARLRVASNLRKVREAAGLSQEDLAVKAGFHRTYVSQIERAVNNATIDNICKLAEFLGIDVHELFVDPDHQ
ncbi:helix-turn-helix transcriptional regulator [Cupriavidus necator]|uniref:helix-turn-helix domain-containing protein n=1 Tax=Cupriavidus necator TaxID=106590 RepID=UPI00339D52ED